MAAGGVRRALVWGALVAALVAILVAASLDRWRRPAPLPYLGVVPNFALSDSRGNRMTLRHLAGRPWIADFVFTRCPVSCPLLTERMARLDRELPAAPPFHLVSFSVDPAHDRPEVLERYARSVSASLRWHFLTGEREVIYALIRKGFKLGVDPLPTPAAPPGAGDASGPVEPITHSTRFVLVDGKARIRGYYDAFDRESIARLRRDLRFLQKGG